MKTALTKLLAMLFLVTSFASCNVTVEPYEPYWHYNCYPVYDYWGYYMYDDCYYEYYNQNGDVVGKDLVADVADKEAVLLERLTSDYAEKYSLSNEAAQKVAKNLTDFSVLSTRSAEDIADFSQKLYGVNPSEIISAVGEAQVGNNTELESVIEKASSSLGATAEQTKAIIKELHGKALEENGIEL
jgi:hypothetical protein